MYSMYGTDVCVLRVQLCMNIEHVGVCRVGGVHCARMYNLFMFVHGICMKLVRMSYTDRAFLLVFMWLS